MSNYTGVSYKSNSYQHHSDIINDRNIDLLRWDSDNESPWQDTDSDNESPWQDEDSDNESPLQDEDSDNESPWQDEDSNRHF